MEQICTGGGNILKPALAQCAKQIEPELECERYGGGDGCVNMCESMNVCKEEMDGELIEGDGLHYCFNPAESEKET